MSIDMKTVVLHCKRLGERKQNIIRQMEKFGFSNYSFYEDYDGDELDEKIIEQYCVRKHKDWTTVAKKISPWKIGIETQKELSVAEVSLTIKFGKVFQELAKMDDSSFIIFEDDVFLCESFNRHFNEFMSATPNDWDAIYFGSGANLKPDISGSQLAYLMPHPASRCADSIVLSNKAVKDLARTWFPFHLISDWELGYQHFYHNHNVYWWEPSLVRQGSEYGMFKSTLR